MKKAKKENSADIEMKRAGNGRNEKNAQNIPSEKIRGKDKTDRELPFKKVLYGYDPDEVASYIGELAESYEASSRIHESKLSSIKEELVLSNRERDSYIKKYKDCTEKLNTQPSPVAETAKDDKSDEYEAIISNLKEKLEQAESENVQLKQTGSQSNGKILDEYAGKLAALESENRQLSSQLQKTERENAQLLTLSQKHDELLNEFQAISAQLELLKAENEAKKNEILALNEEINRKTDEFNALASENETTRKKSAELEAENGVLSQSLEENKSEIQHLKDINKAQAYEYADKVNALENEHAKTNLAMKKELKLHGYYINQAEATLAELSKQMEQIKQSMNDMQSV